MPATFEPPALPLGAVFFDRDARDVARDLLGCMLVSTAAGEVAAGRIVETEAYLGADDAGSHAATRGVTARNAVMYGPPGSVYVYLAYGVHYMLNLVCEEEGIAAAVLVRALEPVGGIEAMERRRGGRPPDQLADGPGKVAQALGVDLSDDGSLLGRGVLTVYDATGSREPIEVSCRIGLSRGHEHEYRWFVSGSRFVSRARPGVRPPHARTGR